MVKDPLFVPEAGIPAECDEIDVGPDTPWDESLKRWWTRDLEFFGGIHGFKGPLDQGRAAISVFTKVLILASAWDFRLGLADWRRGCAEQLHR